MDTGLGGLGTGNGDVLVFGVENSDSWEVDVMVDVTDTIDVCGWLDVRNGLNNHPGANLDAKEPWDCVPPVFLEFDEATVATDREE